MDPYLPLLRCFIPAWLVLPKDDVPGQDLTVLLA